MVSRYNSRRYKENNMNKKNISEEQLSSENLEDEEGSTSSNSDIDSELIRQLGVLNLSINTIYIIVLAIFMNINYLYNYHF